MAIEFEKIKSWDGQSGTGADNRGVIDRNFDKVKDELEAIDSQFVDVNTKFDNVEDEIAQLAGEVSENKMDAFIQLPITLTAGTGYYIETGATLPSQSYSYSQKIRTKEGAKYKHSNGGVGTIASAVFFDINGNFISGTVDKVIVAPEEAYMVGFSGAHGFTVLADRTSFIEIDYESKIDEVDSKIPLINAEINLLKNMNNQLYDKIDLLTDNDYPLLLDMAALIKGTGQPAPSRDITINNRIDDHSFSVNPSDISDWSQSGAAASAMICLKDNENRYKIYSAICPDIATGVIKVGEELPSTLTTFQLSLSGQHLSRNGYIALAEWVGDYIERYAYRKKPFYSFIAQNCTASGQKAIDTISGQVHNFEKIGATPTGGWLVDNITPNLIAIGAETSAPNHHIHLKKAYMIQQKVAGYGVTLNGIKTGINGYCRIIIGQRTVNYSPFGSLNVIIRDENDSVILNKNIVGGNQEIIFNIDSSTQELNFEFSVATSVITIFGISSIEIFQSAERPAAPILQKDDINIAILCDSWGEFPMNIEGDPVIYRADGSSGGGQYYLSEKLKYYLNGKGYNVNTYNHSKGGQTSAWARYWLKHFILDWDVKPDYCIVNFAINDSNSNSFALSNSDSVYDFSSTEPYVNKTMSNGGLRGSVTFDEWWENMKYISNTLLKHGIKPIILSNPMVAWGTKDMHLQLLNNDMSK